MFSLPLSLIVEVIDGSRLILLIGTDGRIVRGRDIRCSVQLCMWRCGLTILEVMLFTLGRQHRLVHEQVIERGRSIALPKHGLIVRRVRIVLEHNWGDRVVDRLLHDRGIVEAFGRRGQTNGGCFRNERLAYRHLRCSFDVVQTTIERVFELFLRRDFIDIGLVGRLKIIRHINGLMRWMG